MTHEHIPIVRDEPIRERHPRSGFNAILKPENFQIFGRALNANFREVVRQDRSSEIDGYDARLLLKITLREGANVPQLNSIQGVEIVSQEDKEVILAFATRAGLNEFESRLSSLANTGRAVRKEILFSIDGFDRWTPSDRKAAALSSIGYPDSQQFILDVELWPLEGIEQVITMLAAFERWAKSERIEILDILNKPSLVVLRVRVNKDQAELMLNHRDVRSVDLPPRVGLGIDYIKFDINNIPQIASPPSGAAKLVVLDTGVASGHPLLAPAIGDAQGFISPNRDSHDDNGHGTFVSGIGLYGDIKERLSQGQFIPELQLFSGRVFNNDSQGSDQIEFVEKRVEEAVRYFKSTYGCRVFNFSYGDLNKVYDGRHLKGLAYTLDRLARELDILFVVPTGNYSIPKDAHLNYPTYLLSDEARLIDPATALNVLTVGGLAFNTQSFDAERNPNSIEDIVIAKELEPSPFTRAGFSIGDAIKPDFVEEAGNAVTLRSGTSAHPKKGLGVLSLNSGFANSIPITENNGTSFASPKIANIAALVAEKFSNYSINLTRAILACHATWPGPSLQLLNPDGNSAGKNSLLRLLGYGRPSKEALLNSTDQVVTLFAEDGIENDRNQFYELPIPDDFWSSGRRERLISVALAYTPETRTTRLDYRQTKLQFSLVVGDSIASVADAFTRNRSQAFPERATGRSISNEDRKFGTLQASTWKFQVSPRLDGKKIYIVVTRQDTNWSEQRDVSERYALSVTISDRENIDVNLYEQIALMVQARNQERTRIRA
jgi:subtilisin family serine protease